MHMPPSKRLPLILMPFRHSFSEPIASRGATQQRRAQPRRQHVHSPHETLLPSISKVPCHPYPDWQFYLPLLNLRLLPIKAPPEQFQGLRPARHIHHSHPAINKQRRQILLHLKHRGRVSAGKENRSTLEGEGHVARIVD